MYTKANQYEHMYLRSAKTENLSTNFFLSLSEHNQRFRRLRLREKCPNTDQKKLRISTLFAQSKAQYSCNYEIALN